MHTYEIEIKSLLGSKDAADSLRTKIKQDPSCALTSTNKQLNHYFMGGNINKLFESTKEFFSEAEQKRFEQIVKDGSNFSIRTRQLDGTVLLVIKASINDHTSANGTARIEFESKVPLTLDELDQKLLDAGFLYQAKWSREREEYTYKGANVTIDKNAGYGYLAEFEKVVDNASQTDEVQKTLHTIMDELGVQELAQDRLERMFAFYNEHWPEYYGTDKIFTIE
jgi:predicted adenylyl cyclase CyaB